MSEKWVEFLTMFMALIAAVISYLNRKATDDVKEGVKAVYFAANTRLDEMLELTRQIAEAKGRLAGAAEEQARQIGRKD